MVEKRGPDRRAGALEALFQEAIRRAAGLGLASFFSTEEALRRAFSDAVPRDWLDFVSRKENDLRADVTDRMAAEFGAWLRTVDLGEVVRSVVAEYDFEVKVSVRGERRSETAADDSTLSLVSRRK